jgi:hypothetical protein
MPTPPLSPAAQAVWDAAWTNCPVQCGNIEGTRRSQIAAALIAAVDRVKLGPDEWEGSKPDDYELGWNRALSIITHIAAELRQEGQPRPTND